MNNFEKTIGHTPMIRIDYRYKNMIRHVFAKLEYYNLTGSIKDRIADYIIKQAYQTGHLKKDQPIIEATSGNTGISFAALGAYYQHPVHIFMPDWVSKERIKIMEMYGAKVHLVSREEGGFQEAINQAAQLAKEIGGFRPDQFNNEDNVNAHYMTTGQEIVKQVDRIDAFVSGIGTGGTLMGVAKRIKQVYPNASILALEPDGLPILTTGNTIGSHKIEGIGDDFIPSIVDKYLIDDVIVIHDMDAINMARLLAQKLGLGVGISSGANFLAAVLTQKEFVVTIFPDDLKKYISTPLSEPTVMNDTFISNQVELLGYEEVKK